MFPRLRRMLFVPLIIIAGVYLCICLYLYIFQNRFLYYPTHDIAVTPDQVGLAYTDQFFELSIGEKVHGWYLPGDSAGPTVLFLHGNGGNVGHRIDHLRLLYSLGVSTLIIDYRGYGRSTGKPSEENLYADAELAFRWLTESKRVPTNKLFAFGESIGGAVAIELASKRKVAGLIVESSFTSLKEIAQHSFPIVPTGLLLRSDYNSIDKLSRIHVPIIVSHSPDDDIVPYQFGRKLFEAANPPKQFVTLFGGHNDRGYLTDTVYTSALRRFFAAPESISDYRP
jgi:hypothetical protein